MKRLFDTDSEFAVVYRMVCGLVNRLHRCSFLLTQCASEHLNNTEKMAVLR